MMADEDIYGGRKQSLRQKYDLTDQQLDFGYVKTCEDPKTLEKILKVLRSKEEGYFPDLEKTVEERLKNLCENSPLLLNAQPVPLMHQLPKEQQEQLSREFLEFHPASDTLSAEELKKLPELKGYPAVRNSEKMVIEKVPVTVKEKPFKSCAPRSYDSWDKFNVDKELSLLDREDELKQNQFVRANNESKIHTNESFDQIRVGGIDPGDPKYMRLRHFAILEKNKGNDCFKARDFQNALRHYSKSLEITPLPEVFNNRAQVYLKLDKYDLALADCNKVLETKQDAKAYYRKSTALMKLERLQEAYESIEKALKIDPNDNEVQERANQIREQLNLHPSTKKYRMVIQEDGDMRKSNPFIEEIPSRDICYPFSSPPDNIQLNEIGTARFMCRCTGNVSPFIAKLRTVEDQPHANRLYLRKTRSKKTSSEKSLANRRSKKVTGSPNGEIIEKDTIEAGEKIASRNESAAICSPQSKLEYYLNSKDLEGIANEMSRMHGSQLSKAFSDRLDSTTLSLCIRALCNHLMPWAVLHRQLVALSNLPQFRSSVKNLDRSSKKVLSAKISEAESKGQRVADLFDLYNLTSPY